MSRPSLRARRWIVSCCLVLAALFAPFSAWASVLPRPVEQNLGALLTLSTRRNTPVPAADYEPLLDFVLRAAGDGRAIVPDRRCDGNGTALRMVLRAPLTRIMRYCYNPSVPNYLMFPSVLRLSGWERGSDILRHPKPWELFGGRSVALWGTEFEVNTPDTFGGAYYRYDLHRLIILTHINGHKALISVSKQVRRSSVGKKAVILDDANWAYFYSGINGLNRGFIGWADTYMYDSASVQVFVEDGPHATTLMLFKWLRAGWAGLNVVKKSHIDNGMLRYASAFRQTMESRRLPDPDDLARHVRELATLPTAQSERKLALYSQAVERLAQNAPAMKKSEFQKVVAGGGYARTMTREERLGTLNLEYFKSRLGKRALVDFSDLPGFGARGK